MRTAVQLRHRFLEGAFSRGFIAACDGFLNLAQVTPNAAAARAVSNATAIVLANAFFGGSAIGHFKFRSSHLWIGAGYNAA